MVTMPAITQAVVVVSVLFPFLFRRGPFSWNMTSRLPYIIHSNMFNSNNSSDSTGRSSLESQIPNRTGQRRELWKQRTVQADVERDPEATPCKATA